jgi:hypothetical protein
MASRCISNVCPSDERCLRVAAGTVTICRNCLEEIPEEQQRAEIIDGNGATT